MGKKGGGRSKLNSNTIYEQTKNASQYMKYQTTTHDIPAEYTASVFIGFQRLIACNRSEISVKDVSSAIRSNPTATHTFSSVFLEQRANCITLPSAIAPLKVSSAKAKGPDHQNRNGNRAWRQYLTMKSCRCGSKIVMQPLQEDHMQQNGGDLSDSAEARS